VVEALAAYAAGEGEAAERDAVAAHLDACEPCRTEQAASNDLRVLLQGAAPITGAGGEDDGAAAEAGWGRLSAALAGAEQEAGPVTVSSAAHPAVAAEPQPDEPVLTPLPRRRPWRSWLGAAAAAGFIALTAWGVAQFDDTSGAGRGEAVAAGAPRVLEGTMARAGDESRAPLAALTPGLQAVALADGATVRASARWTAALQSGTTLTAGPDDGALRLDAGEAVWHVVPRTGGLTVTTPHATVRVLGTLFSVQVDAARTIVAVYHGQVRVDGTDVANTVDAGRAVAVGSDGTPVVLAAAPAPPEWLRPAPVLRAVLSPAPSSQPATRVRFTLTNPGPGLCALLAPNSRDPHFSVSASRPGAAASPAALQRVSVQPVAGQRAAVQGRVLLGPGETYTVECNVSAALAEPGRYRLTARYAVAGTVPAGTFVGTAESAPLDVDAGRGAHPVNPVKEQRK
jgi:ferric-dicitrate binding protein FerR (iron transport regulator)